MACRTNRRAPPGILREVRLPHPSRDRSIRSRAATAAALVATLATVATGPAAAQFVLHDHVALASDRPEAWAMAWFTTVGLSTQLGPPATLAPGGVELALEGGWIPHLSEQQRRVGFLGTKPEELNRSSELGRLRAAVGLPAGVVATLGWVPKATVHGIEPDLLSLSLAHLLWQGERAQLAARLLAERGTFRGDITCPADVVAAGHDPDRNPYGCEQRSSDTMSVRLYGAELQTGTRLVRWPRVSPYGTITASRLHAEFQVRARYNGLVDRTLLETDQTLWSATVGLGVEAAPRVRLAGELFYTPLEVARSVASPRRTDALLNARVSLAYRLR